MPKKKIVYEHLLQLGYAYEPFEALIMIVLSTVLLIRNI